MPGRESKDEILLKRAFFASLLLHISAVIACGAVTSIQYFTPNISKGSAFDVKVSFVGPKRFAPKPKHEAPPSRSVVAKPVVVQKPVSVPPRNKAVPDQYKGPPKIEHVPSAKGAALKQDPVKQDISGSVNGEIVALISNRPPSYPMKARVMGWEGMVVLLADVDSNGRVTNVEVLASSGYDVLDSAAVKAVEKWRFKSIRSVLQIRVPIKFVLTSSS